MSLNLQNYQLPVNKTAYVFSDAAGANACIAMFELNKKIGNRAQLFSNRSHFSEYYKSLIQKTAPELNKADFDCIFLGTSHPASSDYFELNFLKQAKQKNIYTISFVDHWVNFKLRFTDAEGGIIYPNEIWVIDDKAKQLAIEDGLPAGIIKITGSPYHHYLKTKWKESWEGKSYFSLLNIKTNAFHIVFAPDPLSLRNTKEKVDFSEEEALRDILEVISDFKDENIYLVVKCHPLQPEEVLEKEIYKVKLRNVSLIKTADALELISASDLVIGFYSNFLLDAKALGKNVVRYYPGNDKWDLLSHDESLLKIKSKASLHHHLKRIIYG
jgi:hypothetical protein